MRGPNMAIEIKLTTTSMPTQRSVLNVGGGTKAIAIPDRFKGWVHHLLDIDPRGKPDVVCDARLLETLQGGVYDAVYCSHNLEHYFAHDVPKVLRGFHHVLKPDGFIEVRVPDLKSVMEFAVANQLDLTDKLYDSGRGPIMVRDVIYGFGKEIEESGQDFYAYKTGFSPKTLARAIATAKFEHLVMMGGRFELRAYGFKVEPSKAWLTELGLTASPPPGRT